MAASQLLSTTNPVSTTCHSTLAIWIRRVIGVLIILFLLADHAGQLLKLDTAVGDTIDFIYPERVVIPLGLALPVCTVSQPATPMCQSIYVPQQGDVVISTGDRDATAPASRASPAGVWAATVKRPSMPAVTMTPPRLERLRAPVNRARWTPSGRWDEMS